jgi:dTDP-4-dehydrorhamnose reductase
MTTEYAFDVTYIGESSLLSDKAVLIIGAGGLLGGRLTRYLSSRVRVVKAVHGLTRKIVQTDLVVDVMDVKSLIVAVESSHAAVVVNCSGMTSVDACHQRPEASVLVNAIGARNISQAAKAANARLIHISTDHFASHANIPRSETDQIFPVNQYGNSKLLAEGLVAGDDPKALIIRTNFFGVGRIERPTFFDELLIRLRTGAEISGFHDVTFSPIGIERLCDFIYKQLFSSTHGLVNVVGNQELTKLDFVHQVQMEFGDSESQINSISIKRAGLASRRPSYMSLSNRRLREEFGFTPPLLSHMISEEIDVARQRSFL